MSMVLSVGNLIALPGHLPFVSKSDWLETVGTKVSPDDFLFNVCSSRLKPLFRQRLSLSMTVNVLSSWRVTFAIKHKIKCVLGHRDPLNKLRSLLNTDSESFRSPPGGINTSLQKYISSFEALMMATKWAAPKLLLRWVEASDWRPYESHHFKTANQYLLVLCG